jgi:hypothetical protein
MKEYDKNDEDKDWVYISFSMQSIYLIILVPHLYLCLNTVAIRMCKFKYSHQ